MRNKLWVEKYRPKTFDDYVFKDPNLLQQISKWKEDGVFPSLLLSGPPGTGKTTLAKLLINEFDVHPNDILTANGSKECRYIEWLDKLFQFCQTRPFGDFKVVLIDEFDYAAPHTIQSGLRNLMEEYSGSVRFLATCNYPNKIIPALTNGRFIQIKIEKSDITDYTARVATILVEENIEFELETLDEYVKIAYPDLRKCISELQINCIDGKLTHANDIDSNSDFRLEMVDLFRAGKISQARKLICGQASPEEMVDIYRWLYENIEIFGDETKQDKAILIIKQALVDHTLVSDTEINLAACLIRLSHL